MDELTAIGRAQALVKDIASAPVDAVGIAQGLGFEVKFADLPANQAGNTFPKAGRKIICINQNDDPYRQRFTTLHEVAHHVLDLPSKHGEVLPSNELERFTGRPSEEKLCDAFAAACLVPLHLIRPLASSLPFTVETVQTLIELFQASHRCVASSFVRASRELVAYVYAEDGSIQLALPSAAVREAGIYIERGIKLPSGSAASRLLRNGVRFDTEDLDASDWSNSASAENFTCYEEALHMMAWKQTLSLLTFEHLGRSTEQSFEKDDDDERLPPLTGQLPWPRK
ncbi:hypothetical protein TB9_09295 [Xanthomonas perforans]|uniref:IrrE N-terminal-like domain-containing protein n=2 Tax=Xanthomonas perforans TaxID=442694 RepID=A0ABR5EXK6_XANPE|nr:MULTISPECIES: ImmA/IrrE family metallo-endopeptidase [Xanthomonas]KLC09876.1 hypothetical protein XP315_01760 [Xanthomonas perforans]KLC27402.1 hypothetical protein XP816_00200 [Xanthomonas perforans]KLC55866.1 hypothetical protein XP2010_00630 [Xanthomonas perforans]KLC67868.1 hypothetical protein GEV839_02870 [Xanthomonas perforans]KLD17840.1 hypothetical protein GEV1054_13575 [Xanthomonas perforans]